LHFTGLLASVSSTELQNLSSKSRPETNLELTRDRTYDEIPVFVGPKSTNRDVVMNIELELKKRPVKYDFFIVLTSDYQLSYQLSMTLKNTHPTQMSYLFPMVGKFLKSFEMKVARTAPSET
jgi:hypothetical protein